MLNITRVIAEDIVSVMREVLEGDTGINIKVGRNTLADSELYRTLAYEMSESDSIVVSLLANSYIENIEEGRPAGAPPIDFEALARWARRKGITSSTSVIYRIRNAIVRDGISPRPVLTVFFERIDEMFRDKWADAIFEELVVRLDAYFSD